MLYQMLKSLFCLPFTKSALLKQNITISLPMKDKKAVTDINLNPSKFKLDNDLWISVENIINITAQQRELQNKLQLRKDRFMLILEGGNIGAWYWDIKNCTVTRYFSSQYMLKSYHYKACIDGHSVNAAEWIGLIDVDFRENVKAEIERFWFSDEKRFSQEYVINSFVSREIKRWIRIESHFIKRDEQGRPLFWNGTILDITEKKKKQERLRLAASVYNCTSEAMMIVNESEQIIDINRSFSKLMGYQREDILQKSINTFINDLYPIQFFEQIRKTLLAKGVWQGELKQYHKDGSIHDFWLKSSVIYQKRQKYVRTQVKQTIFLLLPISKQKEAERLAWHSANHDLLTGLPNRRMCSHMSLQYDRLPKVQQKEIDAGQEPLLTEVAALYLDIDQFKAINDSLGHNHGDQLLLQVCTRLNVLLQSYKSLFARVGGDEFVILLTSCALLTDELLTTNLLTESALIENATTDGVFSDSLLSKKLFSATPDDEHYLDRDQIDSVCQHILDCLSEPFVLAQQKIHIKTSIGVCLYPTDSLDTSSLMAKAEQAMRVSKSRGGQQFSYFSIEIQQQAQARAMIINELKIAIEQHQFEIYYQPIVDVKTEEVYKFEALIRWNHPIRGMVPPFEFISIAEESGLILAIGDWVFKETCRQLREWYLSYDVELQVSVNKSPVQFKHSKDDATKWCHYINEAGIKASQINIEITEGVLLNGNDYIYNILHGYQQAGMQISLDDFGTGYSSLSYIKKFACNYIKIDRTFIKSLTEDHCHFIFCETIINLAHKLDMKVIAEGVETIEQRDILRKLQCDFIQGYFYSKPEPASSIEQNYLSKRLRLEDGV